MSHCIYPGTFDPITYGHLDVLSRAARLFDRVTVAIADNPGKGPLFTVAERIEILRPNLAQFPNVSLTSFDGLLVDFAVELKANAIIRGLRALSDFEFEFNMALMNRHLKPEIETIFVMPNESKFSDPTSRSSPTSRSPVSTDCSSISPSSKKRTPSSVACVRCRISNSSSTWH